MVDLPLFVFGLSLLCAPYVIARIDGCSPRSMQDFIEWMMKKSLSQLMTVRVMVFGAFLFMAASVLVPIL